MKLDTERLGQVYTPEHIAKFVLSRIVELNALPPNFRCLEPSVGGGVFVDAMEEAFKNESFRLDVLDIDQRALLDLKKRLTAQQKKRMRIENGNFLEFSQRARRKYDLIVGNPPYVSRRNLSKETRKTCGVIHERSGLQPIANHNLWGAFLVASCELLTEDAVLAFVLPEEFLNVKYASELRKFVEGRFQRVEVYSTASNIFRDVDQRAIILICQKTAAENGVFFGQLPNFNNKLKSQQKLKPKSFGASFLGKWCDHLLTTREAALVRRLSGEMPKVSDFCESSAGIVTAANDYFIVNDEIAERYNLWSYCKPIIQKGAYINGSMNFQVDDFEKVGSSSQGRYLLDFSTLLFEDADEKVREYLTLGVAQGIPFRFKCRQRERWFDVPNIQPGEGYFFKRGHQYPKLISNKANVLATDSAYRINMKQGFSIEDLTFSFYNSLTLVCAELYGRSYGGGVLELTPNEFKQLPVPIQKPTQALMTRTERAFEKKASISQFLDKHNANVFSKLPNVSSKDWQVLEALRVKLVSRRQNSK